MSIDLTQKISVILAGLDTRLTSAEAAVPRTLRIAFAGSSTYEKYSTDGPGSTVSNATRSTDGTTFAAMGTQGTGLLSYAAIIANRTGLTAKYLMRGRGGTTVANDWLPAGSGDRANLVNAIKAMGGCDLLNWACGFNDAFQNILVSEAQHLANLRQLFALIRSETGLPNLKIGVGVSQLYTGTETVAPDAKWTALRSAEMTVAQDTNNHFSAHWYDLPQGDGIHMTGASLPIHAARIAENGLATLGLGGAVTEIGPRVTAAAAIYSTKTRVTITHSRGNDFTPTTGLSGFLVSFDDGATFVTPTAAVRVDPTNIDLTHSPSGGAAPTVYDFLGRAPSTSAVIKDNSTRMLPINPSYSAGVKAAAGSSAVDPGTADTTPPVITSPAAFSQPENSAFSTTLTANETVTWSKVGGADTPKFTLSGSTLTLPAQDYEAPADADSNRTYLVTVRATDTAGNTTDQAIAVTITDVAEGGFTPQKFVVAFSRANIAPPGVNAFPDSGTQVQNSNQGLTRSLSDVNGNATSVTITSATPFIAGNDTQGIPSGASYPSGVDPTSGYHYNGNSANGDNGGIAIPSTSYTWGGLLPGAVYTMVLEGYRAASARPVNFTVSTTTKAIAAGNEAGNNHAAVFAAIAADTNGTITFQMAPGSGGAFGYVSRATLERTA